VLLLGATGKKDILLAELDLLNGSADAVGAGGASRGDGEIEALDLERGGQAGRDSAGHDLGDAVGARALDALFPHHVDGFNKLFTGNTAGAHDNAGAGVGYLLGLEGRILDGALHGNVGVGGGVTHETQMLAINEVGGIEVDLPGNIAAQPHLPVFLLEEDAGAARPQ